MKREVLKRLLQCKCIFHFNS